MLKKLLITLFFTSTLFATVTSTETKRQYFECNGSTTTYTFTMECNSSDDIKVEKRLISTGVPTSLTEDTDYTITNTGDSYLEGGVVTIDPALASTYQVVIIREIVQTQETVAGAITPATVVLALDKVTRIGQDNRNDIEQRVIRIPDSDPSTAWAELTNYISRAGYWLGFDSTTGAPFAGTPAATGISVSSFMATVNDDGDAPTARDTLLLTDGSADLDIDDLTVDDITSNDITTKGPWVDVRAFGAVADSGTTDNTTAFTNAIATTKNIFIPFVPGEYYKITDEVTIANAGQVIYSNGADVRQATANKRAFIVTASDVEIRGLKIVGTQFAAASGNNEKGIDVYGADKDNYLSGIKIINCKITTFGDYGIHLEFVEDFEVNNNFIDDIWHAGIQGLQVRRGKINKNNVTDIVGDAPAYGIFLSRQAHNSTTTYPRPSEITIANNVVTNVTNWEGIDTHGGEHISITGNTVDNCKAGIVATAATEGDDSQEFAPLDVSIVGNTITSGVTDGSAFDGISFSGALENSTVEQYATGVISGNMIRGYGLESNTGTGGITCRTTRGLSITGNTIVEPSPVGIAIRSDNQGFNASVNVIIDTWSDTAGTRSIFVVNADNEGYIGGNTIHKGSKTGVTYILTVAIEVRDETTNIITLGPNHSEAAFYLSATATADRCLRGEFGTDFPTTGGGTDDLASTVIPADSLGIGRFLRVTAAGTVTDVNAGNKTIIFKFGSTSINIQAAANTNTDWRFEAVIEYSSAANQRISWVAFNGNTSLQGYGAATEDMTGDVTMEVTGLCADAGDTITQTMWIIERL